jgi:hypothetical protein
MTKIDERNQEILVNAAWMLRAHKAGINVADALTFKESELRNLEAAAASDHDGQMGMMVRDAIEFRREVAKRFCAALDLTPDSLVQLASALAGGERVLL